MKMVLGGLGLEITEAELRNLCDTTILGTDAFKAIEAARTLGFAASGKHNLQLADLKPLVDAACFPIVLVSLRPISGEYERHALVAVEIVDEAVTFYDPLLGEITQPLNVFIEAWRSQRNLALVIGR